jgi:hypothetical protein
MKMWSVSLDFFHELPRVCVCVGDMHDGCDVIFFLLCDRDGSLHCPDPSPRVGRYVNNIISGCMGLGAC